MPLRIDSEQNEVRALQQVTNWRSQRVLEIGCGDGRLTQRLARLGAQVQGIDPDATRIRAARQQLPERLAPQVRFRTGSAERLEYANESFDLVILSWVL